MARAGLRLDDLPSPRDGVERVPRTACRDGTIPEAAVKTLIRLAFSFVVAIVIGTALGVGLALNEFARRSIRPMVVALQITPFIAWLPLAVVWFGADERAVVFVTIVGAFPSVTLARCPLRRCPPLLPGRADAGRRRLGAVPVRDLPGGAARLRRRAAAGVGVRVEGADGGRADRRRAPRATGLGQLLARAQDDVPTLLAALAVIVVIGVRWTT